MISKINKEEVMEHMARVLIVDDVAENITIVKNVLKDKYDVIAATNGEKALELVTKENNLPDLILLDILMPEMDGYEVCKKLKEDERTKDIPVIFLTVLDHAEDMIKGFEYGGVDYITKPFEVNVLLARVDTHVKLKQHQDQLVDIINQKDKILIQQSKLATLGEMFETIMHQWKQPLSIISTSNANIRVENELETLTQETLLRMLDGIDSSITHLTDTIDVFRDYLVETQNKEYILAKDIIYRVTKLLESKLHKENITIDVQVDQCELYILKNHLMQVLINILNNAIYVLESKKGDRKIQVKVTCTAKDLKIVISDNGGGISSENLEHVFEKHFTTKESKKGTGLGLYICRHVTKDILKGEISVENTDKGASFIIDIPLK